MQSSHHLRVETDWATSTRDVSSSKNSLLLMTGVGFGCFALGVASVCLVLPSASHADSLQNPVHHDLAYMPMVMPVRHSRENTRPIKRDSSFLPVTFPVDVATAASMPHTGGGAPKTPPSARARAQARKESYALEEARLAALKDAADSGAAVQDADPKNQLPAPQDSAFTPQANSGRAHDPIVRAITPAARIRSFNAVRSYDTSARKRWDDEDDAKSRGPAPVPAPSPVESEQDQLSHHAAAAPFTLLDQASLDEAFETLEAIGDASADTAPVAVDYSAKTVVQLKDVLRSRGLKLGGRKAELVARLQEDDRLTEFVAANVQVVTPTANAGQPHDTTTDPYGYKPKIRLPAPEAAVFTPPGNSAAWEPYGGYDPKNRPPANESPPQDVPYLIPKPSVTRPSSPPPSQATATARTRQPPSLLPIPADSTSSVTI